MSERTGKSQVAEAILRELKNPLEPRLVKFRPGGGKQLAYIDARDVMKRLDDVMGAENWQDKYIPVEGGFICELSLRIEGEWITKSNGANNTKIEPVKGGISGALKRAAVNWGLGRYLYYMPSTLNSSNIETWPEIFKPGAPVNWEDIAELEADMSTGMDIEETVGMAIETSAAIMGAKTKEEFDKVLESLSGDDRRLFADVINNKLDEFTDDDDSTS